jgi:hypothetical protein
VFLVSILCRCDKYVKLIYKIIIFIFIFIQANRVNDKILVEVLIVSRVVFLTPPTPHSREKPEKGMNATFQPPGDQVIRLNAIGDPPPAATKKDRGFPLLSSIHSTSSLVFGSAYSGFWSE